MLTTAASVVVVLFAFQSAIFLDPDVPLAPASWAIISVCIWLLVVLSKGGWSRLSANDTKRFAFGIFAAVSFLNFLQNDKDFKGWSSVYYFCGDRFQYCTCHFRWNIHGWLKALVLWQFMLSATLGAQQLIIQAGLGGLLPGEEAVTRESFISICWRLVPYWLNNWEQHWGAEVSSMTFELPHFAVELLIILPCCQIICSRLKVLVTPQVNVLVEQPEDQRGPLAREDFAPNVLQGFWDRRPEQRRFLPRARANLRVLAFLTGLTALAALNATLLPLYLEGQAAGSARTPAVMLSGRHSDWLLQSPLSQALEPSEAVAGALAAAARVNATAAEVALLPEAVTRADWYIRQGGGGGGCPSLEPYVRSVKKHAAELTRMQDPEHRSLIPLVESALAIMRLSCEKYFTLLAIYLAFLLFRDPPTPARALIRLVARISSIFQKVILFAFPAVCWLYDAGYLFSIFVSVVFWGAPLLALYESARTALREVTIKSLTPAFPEEIHRMGGSCPICWGDMAAGGSEPHRAAAVEASEPSGSQPGSHPPHSAATAAPGRVAEGAAGSGSGPVPHQAHVAAMPQSGDRERPGRRWHEQQQQRRHTEPHGCPDSPGAAEGTAATSSITTAALRGRGRGPEGETGAVAGGSVGGHDSRCNSGSVGGHDSRCNSGSVGGAAGSGGSPSSLRRDSRPACCEGDGGGASSSMGGAGGRNMVGSSEQRIGGRVTAVGDEAPNGHHGELTVSSDPGPSIGGAAAVSYDLTEGTLSQRPGAGAHMQEGAEDTVEVSSDGPGPFEATSLSGSPTGSAAASSSGSGTSGPTEGSADPSRDASSTLAAAGGGSPGGAAAGWSLPCGHAFHHTCLMQWMEQCASSGTTPTCPMCQRGIQLQVRWRLPPFLRRSSGAADTGGELLAIGTARRPGGGGGGGAAGGGGPPAVVPDDLGAEERLLDVVRALAGADAGLQVVGLLEHQRELLELLHEAPALELGEVLREAQAGGAAAAAAGLPVQPPLLDAGPQPHPQDLAQQEEHVGQAGLQPQAAAPGVEGGVGVREGAVGRLKLEEDVRGEVCDVGLQVADEGLGGEVKEAAAVVVAEGVLDGPMAAACVESTAAEGSVTRTPAANGDAGAAGLSAATNREVGTAGAGALNAPCGAAGVEVCSRTADHCLAAVTGKSGVGELDGDLKGDGVLATMPVRSQGSQDERTRRALVSGAAEGSAAVETEVEAVGLDGTTAVVEATACDGGIQATAASSNPTGAADRLDEVRYATSKVRYGTQPVR